MADNSNQLTYYSDELTFSKFKCLMRDLEANISQEEMNKLRTITKKALAEKIYGKSQKEISITDLTVST